MLVANSFDLWQKDTFFSAAEEVQRSADIMESAFRTWLREKKEGTRPQFWDDLTRELQMALGTAKWQLEEFERAVRLSYRSRDDEITMTRHRQFVSVIEEQISSVEEALRESFDDEKKPLRWVNLDEKERDDLALFLSGTISSSKSAYDGDAKLGACVSGSPQKRSARKHSNFSADRDQTSFGNVSSNKDSGCVDGKQSPRSRDICQPDRMHTTQRTSSSDLDSVVIVINDTNEQEEISHLDIEATPKEKGVKSHFRRPSTEDSSQVKAGLLSYSQLSRMNFFNQFFGRVVRSQRQLHAQPIMKITRSIRFMLVFMLAIFLVVPFLVYST
ncbi:hypothetical protein M9H77_06310 [Catharanthus roseus]|uniref:Uncharacterized protein n=1 Tax=Catharanthus roseus TaxID=4058 RepID=A0ACC0BRV8_CATRO|nr:hypothetical protein M9H77_06310 [Catharanthus roseus]